MEGVAGCTSKSDASVTFGSRRVDKVVNSLVVVLGRGARPEGVTLKYTVFRLTLVTPADTWCTSPRKDQHTQVLQGLLLLLRCQ